MNVQLDRLEEEMLKAVMKAHRQHNAKRFLSEVIKKLYLEL